MPPGNTSPLIGPLILEKLGLAQSQLATIAYSVAVAAAVYLPGVLLLAMYSVWLERKVAGRIQSRPGPDRVGWAGLLQSLADGIKLISKEDLTPTEADRPLFRIAPYLAFAPVFAAFAALPFGPNLIYLSSASIGLFWILSVLSIEVMGVILAGWASNNKWSVYGAMREACQIVSYEIPLGLAVLIATMSAGTLDLIRISELQGGGLHTWLIFRNPFIAVAYVVFFVASLAANKRAPFDLPESESELVAGYHTEYSGLRFGFFFFADYAAMFLVGGLQAALFLGGWNDPFGWIGWKLAHANGDAKTLMINAIGAVIFSSKAALVVFIQMWLRWTLPRPRIDQVLYTCVQVLLPAGCALLIGVAVWQLFVPELNGIPWRDFNPWLPMDLVRHGSVVAFVTQSALAIGGLVGVAAVVVWIGRAIWDARSVHVRLSEPAPINLGSPAQPVAGS